MKCTDSRRLTGPNLLLPGCGAILEVELEGEEPCRVIEAWRSEAEKILAVVGWPDSKLAQRLHRGGLSLALSAPVDALYAATEVNERAFEAARVQIEGGPSETPADAASRLIAAIGAERSDPLRQLMAAASRHGVSCLVDDDHVSVGLGCGSVTWPAGELPAPGEVEWSGVHDIPVALVTGTNGKSTTVRMLTSILDAAGKTAGSCSTDWIRVGHEIVDRGDYSGPGGARQALRHRDVEIAVLETARGGMLRRGLAVERAGVALVTNVAEDHLGESGIYDLEELARAKLVVHRVASRLVLNADDPLLVRYGSELGVPITWFTLDSGHEMVARHRANGGFACRLVGRKIVFDRGQETSVVTSIEAVPVALGGAARHNLANALGAAGVAAALGVGTDETRAGLAGFRSDPGDNPGRLNLFELGDVTAIVDFAHNPHGVAALLEMAEALPARRRLVTTGQAGDRDDDSIRKLGATIAAARPDRVIVKEMVDYLRGRAKGEVSRMIVDQLVESGLSPDAILEVESEMDAVRQALAWAREGDLLLLVTHSRRSGVVSYLEELRRRRWSSGDAVPRPRSG